MRILVNHLTRMQPGYICVAGLDEATGQHIRPVLLGMFGEHWVTRYGGPFDMGEVIVLGNVVDAADPPHIEDRRCVESAVFSAGPLEPQLFWKVLKKRAMDSIEDIFGPELIDRGRSVVLEEGTGLASLGVLEPVGRPGLFLLTTSDGHQRLRIQFNDRGGNYVLPVTDLRFYDNDLRVKMDVFGSVNQRLTRGVQALLSVGLTRLFSPAPDEPGLHWLQCNNIHLADDPAWRLVEPAPGTPYYDPVRASTARH